MMSLDHPEFLWFLLVIPVMLIIFIIYLAWQKKVRKNFGDRHLLDKMSGGMSRSRPIIKTLFFTLGIAFLILGLVNPKLGTKLETVKRKGADVVFALDVSKSMLAEDIAPDRLSKAKYLIQKTIGELRGDRVGIIVYAGGAYPLLPITTDYSSALLKLKMAEPNLVPSGGTALDQALEQSIQYFDNETQKNRLLVLVSDGEDHDSGWKQSLGRAKEKGIKVVAIGMGTEKGAPIPLQPGKSNSGYKKDREGQVVVSKLNKQVLLEISSDTGGIYLNGNDTKEVIEELGKLVDQLDKEEIESREFTEYEDQFQWFLLIGLFFLCIDIFVVSRKTRWMEKIGLIKSTEH